MFVEAIEEVDRFTRPAHFILRYYTGSDIVPGTATLFFVNKDGFAVTCRHVAKQILYANSIYENYVKFSSDVENLNVVEEGRSIRYNKEYAAEGINVNFVETVDDGTIYVRTYERGVENETLSCGTGVTAAALLNAHNENGFNEVKVKTPGGSLSVEFDKIDNTHFKNIWLCGPAELVYSGEIEI